MVVASTYQSAPLMLWYCLIQALHTYVYPYFASHFGKQLRVLDHSFLVSTPMGESLCIQSVFRSCVVSVNEVDTLADLTLLEMIDLMSS